MASQIAQHTPARNGVVVEDRLAGLTTGTSVNLIIPQGILAALGAALVLKAAGTAKLQFTLLPRITLMNGGDVATDWIDWTAGAVTATTYATLGRVTGVRVVVTSGTWDLDIEGA